MERIFEVTLGSVTKRAVVDVVDAFTDTKSRKDRKSVV